MLAHCPVFLARASRVLPALVVLAATWAAPSHVQAEPGGFRAPRHAAPVFRLGRFDGASSDFAQDVPTAPVHVVAASAGAAQAWYAFQPQAAAGAGLAAAPRTLQVALPARPAALYTVRVGLLIEHASVPALRVAVNGHEGTFFLDPQLDRKVGDGGAVSFPSYSRAEVCFAVPGTFLQPGNNELAFSAVPVSAGPQLPDAGFNYDALEMTEGPDASCAAAPSDDVRVQPTVFYKTIDGRLSEAVDVRVRHGGGPLRAVALESGGQSYPLPTTDEAAWGETQTRVYLPAPAPHTRVQVTLMRGARRQVVSRWIDPQKRWTVYVVPHVHFDLGYTDFQAKVASVQSRVVDEALDLMDLHPDFRFSMDGMWSFEQFLATRTPADQERALAAMRARKLFIPAQYSNELTGFASNETLIRSLYPGAQWALQHGTPLNYANITDVPSYSWSYASILASAGLHELIAGANNGRAPVLLRGHLDEDSPFYWEGPDGQRVLVWYALHYHQLWTLFGLPPVRNAGEQTLPLFLQAYQRPSYTASSVLLYGSQVENTDLFPGQATIVADWNKEFAFPHMQYSGFHEALEAIAAQTRAPLPIVRGDGGPYWEDGIAGDTFYAAMERSTEARAPTAEKLATLSALANPRLAVDQPQLHEMWRNMVLMDEHTWGASESFSDSDNEQATAQLKVKDSYAVHAAELSDHLLRHAMADLADATNTPANSLMVFNGLNWQRSGMVSADVRHGYKVVDGTTGAPIPVEVVERSEHTSRLRFWAKDVPSLGYRTYRLVEGAGADDTAPAQPVTTLESPSYRVVLDPATGAIRSLYDKQLGRELADEKSPYRLGQYLYVTTTRASRPEERFAVHGATGGRLLSVEDTADEVIAHLQSTDLNTPTIQTSVILSKHEKNVRLVLDIDKQPTKADEAVYVAFPFAMDTPTFHYEIQNGVVDPARNMYPGAGLDWFSAQHWASVQQGQVAAYVMPLDASLVTFGDISRLQFPSSFGQRPGSLFSYAMNNYWHTNYRAQQGGHFQLRYVLTSAPPDDTAISHAAWEQFTPLEISEVTSSDKAVALKRPLSGTSGSFLELGDPAVVLQAWKPAEDGRGTILRFLDLGGPARTLHLRLPQLVLEHAWLADSLERDGQPLTPTTDGTLDIPITPHSIVTVRVQNRMETPASCGRYCPESHASVHP